ncbi:hypothetical protein PYCC9005_001691 [Savitreella phatthalungensis]
MYSFYLWPFLLPLITHVALAGWGGDHEVADGSWTDMFHSTDFNPDFSFKPDTFEAAYLIMGTGNMMSTGKSPITDAVLFQAENILLRPASPAGISNTIVKVGTTHMTEGDRAVAGMWQDTLGWVGFVKKNGTIPVVVHNNVDVVGGQFSGNDSEVVDNCRTGGPMRVRVVCDVMAAQVRFQWSVNKVDYIDIGQQQPLLNAAQKTSKFFMTTYATVKTGGSVWLEQIDYWQMTGADAGATATLANVGSYEDYTLKSMTSWTPKQTPIEENSTRAMNLLASTISPTKGVTPSAVVDQLKSMSSIVTPSTPHYTTPVSALPTFPTPITSSTPLGTRKLPSQKQCKRRES